ncbi:glycosyltransferase [Clostridium sp. AF19-22AC]|jgi:glucosyltransferase|uniref:glycosyltransferase family 2 protein n=1 Tax=Clostridia TaxID=186801 RepID=UPI000E4E8EF5|nr:MULTISPECIES: glycosyltransferase family 2 protein [Clostridia]RHR25828.1 glycosyltransferase [Clostridium sp. AF19-22AC]
MCAISVEERKTPLCSIVVPCYNEEIALPIFFHTLLPIINGMTEKHRTLDWEIWIIDDGSVDDTLKVAKDFHQREERIHYLSFSRNFGKEAAIYAGLQNVRGDYVVTMDVDLQDPPSLLPDMYRAVTEEGYDCVATRRVSRKGEPVVRSFFARRFYRLLNRISNTGVVDGARDFRFMKRQVVNAILSMKEYNRFSKGIYEWVGFKTKYLEYENVERSAGQTKWSFWKLFKYSIEGIVAFSTAPLAIASVGGIFLCMIAFIMIVFLILRALMFGDPVAGWPSMACIIIFLGGVQLFSSGILGMYLSRTYLECKKRPLYIMQESE